MPARKPFYRGLVFAISVLAAAGVAPVAAHAHRDGCHRWHSCPSDTGSYVCGDLGYDSECGDTGGTREEELDLFPPDVPLIGTPTVAAGGKVSLTVTAERGSRVEVLDQSTVVARATGNGGSQPVILTARSGSHTYTVRAADASGNVSELSAPVNVDVDADAPAVDQLQVVPARPELGASTVSFTTEPDARYELTVAGRKDRLVGAVGDGPTSLQLWLPNGRYTIALVVRDSVGNVRKTSVPLAVAVSRPALRVERTSAPGASPAVFVVTASPRSRGTLTVPGYPPSPYVVDNSGQATVSLELDEGAYGAGRATLTDFAGRAADTTVDGFTVDTIPPSLAATVDTTKARRGLMALSVSAEEGATVTVTGALGDAGSLSATFTAGRKPNTIDRKAGTGTYRLTVVAKDAVGNETKRTVNVEVVRPLSAAEVLGGIAALILVLLLTTTCIVGVGWLAWRQRRALGDWRRRRRERAAARAQQRRLAAQRAAHERAVAAHQAAYAAWQRDETAWKRRREEMQSHLKLAEQERGSVLTDFATLRLRRDERLFGSVPGAMVEVRSRQGATHSAVLARGSIVITDQRVVFVGPTNREWSFEKLQAHEHVGADMTLLHVTNRQKISGFTYGDAVGRNRLLLDLAIADSRGEREQIAAQLRARLAEHDGKRPAEPKPPQPPTVADGTILDAEVKAGSAA